MTINHKTAQVICKLWGQRAQTHKASVIHRSTSQITEVDQSVSCSTLSGCIVYLTPDTWHLLALSSASISGVTSWVAANSRTRSQRYVSSCGNLATDSDQMCWSQLRKNCPSNPSHAASLLFQVGCWRADQSVSFSSSAEIWSVAQTPVTVPLLCLWTASCRHVLGRAHIFQTGEARCISTGELRLPQWQLQPERTCAVRCCGTTLLQLFVQVLQLLCNIQHKCEVLHPF